jgi:hypothetical protein
MKSAKCVPLIGATKPSSIYSSELLCIAHHNMLIPTFSKDEREEV